VPAGACELDWLKMLAAGIGVCVAGADAVVGDSAVNDAEAID
jgi:hypothetical protein